MEPKNLLAEISSILEPYGIEKIILFGSYAYGTPKEDSDIDLLVIKDIPSEEIRDFRIKIKKVLWVKLGTLSYSLDILVDNEQRIKERIEMGDLFYEEIYSKGKTIYASGSQMSQIRTSEGITFARRSWNFDKTSLNLVDDIFK